MEFLILSLALSYSEGVSNTTEHWNEPGTPYNEDTDGRMIELVIEKESTLKPVREYVYIHSGKITNSLYLPTDVNGIGGRGCIGGDFYGCWGSGVIGFKGYPDQPTMFDGFFYVPELNFTLGYKWFYYRSWYLPLTNVETHYAGFILRF